MSSPITNTRSSRSISCPIASEMAWAIVSVRSLVATAMFSSPLDEDVLEGLGRVRQRALARKLVRRGHALRRARRDLLVPGVVEHALLPHCRGQLRDRVLAAQLV